MHFIGIGGAGMSGLAEILMDMGHSVSGSDREVSAITEYLSNKGATIYIGHSSSQVRDVDFVVYSSAIPEDNPEREQAKLLGVPQIRRAEMLGQLFNRKYGIGIAGTHGKTTTTSMLGAILLQTDLDPTIIVGGRFQNLMTNARLGQGEIVLAEADEYDRSFLALQPRIAVLTSLEADHLDIYEDLDDLKETFLRFAGQVPFDGSLIYSADDANLTALADKFGRSALSFGFSEKAQLQARITEQSGMRSEASFFLNGKKLGNITLNIPGAHNIKNALAATACALELDVPFQKIRRGLANFKGVGRRFEIIGEANRILVVDDYAHHPSEVEAAISAARKGWKRNLVVVFQPHLFTRTRDFAVDFGRVISQSDYAVITGIYPAREEEIPGISGKLIADQVQCRHSYVDDKNDLVKELLNRVEAGSLVLFLGAGDIWRYSRLFLEQLQAANGE